MMGGREDLRKSFGSNEDPATIIVNRLKKTRYISRMAKLGDGIYGVPSSAPARQYVLPPLADLVGPPFASAARVIG